MNQETPRSYARKDIEIIKNIEIGTQILNSYIIFHNIFLKVTFFYEAWNGKGIIFHKLPEVNLRV